MTTIAPEWGTAEVASILTASNLDGEQNFAVFALKPNTETIYSLDPAEDYEINPHTIDGWRMICFDENGETIGDADYHVMLEQLQPFVIEQNNNSILVKSLTPAELEQVFRAADGKRTIQLTL